MMIPTKLMFVSEKETYAYDNLCPSAIESSDEDTVPTTPEMSTAEQIETIYSQLQRLQADLERIHRQREAADDLNDDMNFGCGALAPVLACKPDWEEQYINGGGGEDTVSFREDILPQRHSTSRQEVDTTRMMDGLPPEILMYIFELCLEDDAGSLNDGAGFRGLRVRQAPLLLCHVCQYWRRLAEGTPTLWGSFSLVIDREILSVDGLKVSMDLWCRNSGSMDMAINLEVDPAAGRLLDGALMDRLKDMLGRCRRLRINVSDEMLRRVLSLSLPSLQTLEIRTSWLRKDVQDLDVRAPKLRTLVMFGPTMCRFTKESLPWTQLKEYKGTCWADMQRHLDIIRLCSNLERCTLFPFYEMKGRVIPIRMESLKRLHVASYLGTSVGGFLRWMEVPGIEELTLEITEESPAYSHAEWPKKWVVDLLERSNGRLKKLELIGMKVEEEMVGTGRLFGCETNVVQPL